MNVLKKTAIGQEWRCVVKLATNAWIDDHAILSWVIPILKKKISQKYWIWFQHLTTFHCSFSLPSNTTNFHYQFRELKWLKNWQLVIYHSLHYLAGNNSHIHAFYYGNDKITMRGMIYAAINAEATRAQREC